MNNIHYEADLGFLWMLQPKHDLVVFKWPSTLEPMNILIPFTFHE